MMQFSYSGTGEGDVHTLDDLYRFLAACEKLGTPRDARLNADPRGWKSRLSGSGPLQTLTAVWDDPPAVPSWPPPADVRLPTTTQPPPPPPPSPAPATTRTDLPAVTGIEDRPTVAMERVAVTGQRPPDDPAAPPPT